MIVKKINVAERPEELVSLGDGLFMLRINALDESVHYKWDEVDEDYIQFHFGLNGKGEFLFNNGNYTMGVEQDESLLFYNPDQQLPLDLKLEEGGSVISLYIKIEVFHSFFTNVSGHIPFLNEENRHKKYYSKVSVSPQAMVVLTQMKNFKFNPSLQELYLKGKLYELLCIYFNKSEGADDDSCPFLMDAEYLGRVKRAKEMVVDRMTDPPSLEELSESVGLNIKKLKLGFKQVYGSSVFNFLFDYKMDYSRKLIESGKYNVNEIGLMVGYSTASHFIASFKKKFGTTPKKYMQSQNLIH